MEIEEERQPKSNETGEGSRELSATASEANSKVATSRQLKEVAEAASGTAIAAWVWSLHGHCDGEGKSPLVGASDSPGAELCCPQHDLRWFLTPALVAFVASCPLWPSRVIVQQQSNGPASSEMINW